uniref:Uncharacterized protein n=1 Tax=Timema monikensis TaxID=170555 RepID=A0A7R9E0Y7_9NEOP|nr:unnamed protein product [Timema monikensis]
MSESTHSEFEDPYGNDRDKDYQLHPYESQSSQSEESASGSQDERPRKRLRKVAEWKRTKAKRLRNTGKQYQGKRGESHAQRMSTVRQTVTTVQTQSSTSPGPLDNNLGECRHNSHEWNAWPKPAALKTLHLQYARLIHTTHPYKVPRVSRLTIRPA